MADPIHITECSQADYQIVLRQFSPVAHPISFTQAPFYGAWQERDGKTVVYFTALRSEKIVAVGLAVKYDAPGGISFFYCPYGPVAAEWTPELLAAFRHFFAPIAQHTGATFVRLDSDGLHELTDVKPASNRIAVTASLQPRVEWLLDITKTEDELWMAMHKHARYNVRLAERANATLDFYTPADAPLDTFFTLMQTTAERDTFGLMSKAYYQGVLSTLSPADGFVAICTIDDKPAAAALLTIYDQQAHYVYAASSNEFRKIAPPYFVIWRSLLEAKKRECTLFNFGGISDPVKNKHLEGVTSFKKRFGGYEATHRNPVDLVYKPLKYNLFKLYKHLH